MQAALVHAQFETIHPFDDGNGRTGRALIYVVLRRRGIASDYVPPISVILAGQRDRYIAGLTSFRGERVDGWIGHFAAAASSAARLALRYLEAVRALQEQWRAQLSASAGRIRQDSAAWTLIEVLPAHPVISGPIAVAATGRSKPQVYLAIEQLEKADVLVSATDSQRNRRWEAAGLLDLLEGLEAGETPERIDSRANDA